jgi:hypothetical protein
VRVVIPQMAAATMISQAPTMRSMNAAEPHPHVPPIHCMALLCGREVLDDEV